MGSSAHFYIMCSLMSSSALGEEKEEMILSHSKKKAAKTYMKNTADLRSWILYILLTSYLPTASRSL